MVTLDRQVRRFEGVELLHWYDHLVNRVAALAVSYDNDQVADCMVEHLSWIMIEDLLVPRGVRVVLDAK